MLNQEAFNYLALCFERAMKEDRISELKLKYPHFWKELISSGAMEPKGAASDRLIMVDFPEPDEPMKAT